jgi:hypothetical protein
MGAPAPTSTMAYTHTGEADLDAKIEALERAAARLREQLDSIPGQVLAYQRMAGIADKNAAIQVSNEARAVPTVTEESAEDVAEQQAEPEPEPEGE